MTQLWLARSLVCIHSDIGLDGIALALSKSRFYTQRYRPGWDKRSLKNSRGFGLFRCHDSASALLSLASPTTPIALKFHVALCPSGPRTKIRVIFRAFCVCVCVCMLPPRPQGVARDVPLHRRVFRQPVERPRSGQGLQGGRGQSSGKGRGAARLHSRGGRFRRERVGGGQPRHPGLGEGGRGLPCAVISYEYGRVLVVRVLLCVG